MKKALLSALLAVAVTGCASTLFAQMPEGQGQGGGVPHQMAMGADQRLQHLTQMLNLTTDQQAKIKPILENESQQMQAMRQDNTTPQQDKMAKMREIRQNTRSQIKPVLTADQQKKWEEQMQGHRNGPPGVGPGAHGGPPAGAEPGAPPPPQ